MKIVSLLAFCLFAAYGTTAQSFSALNAQEFSIDGLYAGSSWKKYSHNFGYNVGYGQYFGDRYRVNLSFQHLECNQEYDDIRRSSGDGESFYIEEYTPQNKLNSVNIGFGYKILKKNQVGILCGPEMGLNYYKIHEQYTRIANGFLDGGDYKSDFQNNNKLGIGLFVEINCKEVIFKGLSFGLAIHPGITTIHKSGLDGSNLPARISWIRTYAGIKYSIKTKASK